MLQTAQILSHSSKQVVRPAHSYWLIALLGLATLPAVAQQSAGHPPLQVSAPTPAVARQQAKTLSVPLSFEPNQGQADPAVRFLSRGSGYSMFLTQDEVVLNLERQKQVAKDAKTPGHKAASATVDTLRMRLQGANPATTLAALDQHTGIVNYLLGNDPAKWQTGVPTYGKVRYTQVYPGVDLVFYGNQRQLEYDFVVAPGADASKIAWQIDDAKPTIDADGNLVLTAADGPATFKKPVIYQLDGDKKTPVAGSFMLADNKIGFQLGIYDHSKPLVIDPVLSYATYLGGSGLDYIGNDPYSLAYSQGLAIDSAGSVYVTGTTNSLNFPVANAYSGTNNLVMNNNRGATTFVTKFSPDGSSLVYSTYLGGTSGAGTDYAFAIAVDTKGDAYVTGQTYSNDFPVTAGAFQTICAPTPYGTPVQKIASCQGAGNSSAYITELNPSGTGLVYSTFLGGGGGGGTTYGTGIAVDQAGRAYVTGIGDPGCSSSNPGTCAFPYSAFPTTSGAIISGTNPTNGLAGSYDSFVTVFDATGSTLLYSTLFGSPTPLGGYANSWFTIPTGIAVDANGYFYISGTTSAATLPTTAGVFQPTAGPSNGGILTNDRGFVAKFNPVTSTGGASLAYATYLGGATQGTGDVVGPITADSAGNAYVTGSTNSSDFPTTTGSYQPTCGINGGNQICHALFVTKINPTGSALVWSTYLGDGPGSPNQANLSGPIALDGSGNVYTTGNWNGDFPQMNAVEGNPNIYQEQVIAELDAAGKNLLFSTYVNAPYAVPAGLAVDPAGNIYAAGNINNTSLITTPGAFQPAFGGTNQAGTYGDGYVLKISAQGTATVGLKATPSPVPSGQSATLTATVTPTATYASVPTGMVQFKNGSTVLNTATVNASGVAIYTGTLNPGQYTLTAVYSGDSTYPTASGTTTLTVNGLTPTITVTPASSSVTTASTLGVKVAVAGSGATPSGTVTLTAGTYSSTQTLSSGSFSFTIPANSLTAGTDTINVSYSGDSNYSPGTGSASITVTVAPIAPTVKVTPGVNSLNSGSTLSVTASVSGTGATPTGTVTLTGGGYTSTAQALASGSYTFNIPANTLSVGMDTLTANYSGDSNYTTGTGTATVTVAQSTFALAATNATATRGANATSTVTVSTTTAYTGVVNLACALTSSPTGAIDLPTCSAGSSTVTLGGSTTSGTATVTISSTAASALLRPSLAPGWTGTGGTVLALMIFFGIPVRRRRWQNALGLLGLMVALGSLGACNKSTSTASTGTTPGAYTFTITGNGTPSLSPAPTTTFTLTLN